MAKRVASVYLPRGGREDLLPVGRLAVWEAIESFDSSLGVPFTAFCWQVVGRRVHTALKAAWRLKHRVLADAVSLSEPALSLPARG